MIDLSNTIVYKFVITDMACTMDCNPLSDDIQQYDDPCCDPANTGKFIKIIESKVHRKYIACPKAPSDWCSL